MRGLGLFLTLCAAVPALAQDMERLPLVGVLRINSAANNEPTATLLRDELAALGDVDGKNIRLEFRLAEGNAGRFPELAEALVREHASVIVAQGPAAALAAQRATRSIPIVAAGNDLVALGLVESMPRPGHNITGVSLLITELDAKRLEVLKEILPSARHFGLLSDPAISEPMGLTAITDTARALGVELQTVHARDPTDFPAAIASLRADGAEGVNILSSPPVVPLPRRAWCAAARAQACVDLRCRKWPLPHAWRAMGRPCESFTLWKRRSPTRC